MGKDVEKKASELLERGVEHLRKGNPLEALSCVEKSLAVKETVRGRSYLGLLIAQERGKLREGLAMCNAALEEEPENPEYYLNLGKTLYKAQRKKEGIQTARKGLYYGKNDDAEAWLSIVGIRRRPIFPFLPRNHFLNKYLGLLLYRLGFR